MNIDELKELKDLSLYHEHFTTTMTNLAPEFIALWDAVKKVCDDHFIEPKIHKALDSLNEKSDSILCLRQSARRHKQKCIDCRWLERYKSETGDALNVCGADEPDEKTDGRNRATTINLDQFDASYCTMFKTKRCI